jgi:hypothetical protein
MSASSSEGIITGITDGITIIGIAIGITGIIGIASSDASHPLPAKARRGFFHGG